MKHPITTGFRPNHRGPYLGWNAWIARDQAENHVPIPGPGPRVQVTVLALLSGAGLRTLEGSPPPAVLRSAWVFRTRHGGGQVSRSVSPATESARSTGERSSDRTPPLNKTC